MSAAAQQSHHPQARHAAPWLTPGQRRLLAACAATVGVVAAYKVYRSERLKSTHAALQTAADTLARYSDAASSVGQMAAVVAADIRTFLASDSDEVPRSLRQLAKLARSSDVQDTLAACVASSIKGVLSSDTSAEPGQPTLVDKVIEAVLSDRGQTLVGLAVRTAAHQSTETFCLALRQGLEAALQASGLGAGQQQQQQQTPQQQQYASPTSPGGPAGAFYSALSSPATGGSPQQQQQQRLHVPYHVQTFTAYGSGGSGAAAAAAAAAAGGMHPAVRSVLAILNSPQLLQAVDGLVSTCVGSTVGAYMAQAGSNDNMLSSVLHTLSQPGNKALVIDIMSQVSATFCREMAAACVAPAAAVASRPSSRLSDSPAAGLSFEDQQTLMLQRQLSASPIRVGPLQMQQQQQAVASSSRSNSASPFKHGGSPQQQPQQGEGAAAAALHHSISEGAFSQVSGAGAAGSSAVGEDACGGESGSEPSSPQSGPSTPEPSVAAAEAGGVGSSQQQQQRQGSYGSFAGSAVAGLILRRQSFGGLLGGGGAGGSAGMFNRGGGPVQFVGGAGVTGAGVAGAAGANGPVLVDPSALGPMSTAVSLFVQAARFQEFRSLMIDVTRSSTREFVHSLLPAGWARAVGGSVASRRRGGGADSINAGTSLAVTVALHRVYTAVSVLILLMVYALSPKTILLEGGI